MTLDDTTGLSEDENEASDSHTYRVSHNNLLQGRNKRNIFVSTYITYYSDITLFYLLKYKANKYTIAIVKTYCYLTNFKRPDGT